MKRTVIISLILALAALFAAIAVSSGRGVSPPEQSQNTAESYGLDAEPDAEQNTADRDISIRLLDEGQVKVLSLDDYLKGVVSAEMPADFDIEALKAQAVAARTYTMYKLFVEPPANHPEADVCSDVGCCKAYISEQALRARWGASFDENTEKINHAVKSTDGQYLKYADEPILAVFHSSSPGKTERSENVWSRALPYLINVDSPETQGDVPNYVSTVEVLKSEYIDMIKQHFPAADFSSNPIIGQVSQTEGGRVHEIVTGGVTVSGTDMRSIFGLRSAAFELSESGDNIVFTVSGYGHGVGMSQYGANVLAHSGSNYIEILSWYYPGTTLGSITELY